MLVGALVAAGAYVHAQVPQVTQLSAPLPGTAVSAAALDAQAATVTTRLASAAGRTLETLAEQAGGPVANAAETSAPTVGGAQAATPEQAKALEELSAAEQAAAEQLAMTEEQLADAAERRKKAARTREEEEAAAARAIDDAIDAAIQAAGAQGSFPIGSSPLLGTSTGAIPEGMPTSTATVLKAVREYFPANQVGNAMAVSRCESGHANRVSQPNSNGTRDYGVFQINDGGTLQAALRSIGESADDLSQARRKALDTETNVRMAYAIWESRGWQPWVCAAKLKVVAGLYQRTPGPMSGKYDDYGRA